MLKFSRRNKKLVIPVGINPNYNIEVKDLYTTKDADVVAGDIIAGKVAYGSDGKLVGTLDLESEKATSFENGYAAGQEYGYESGYGVGREEGFDAGIEDQKAKLETITITENGTYNREDGYNEVIVEVPDLNGDYNEGYSEGYSEGYGAGESAGYNSGFSAGNQVGYENGYRVGNTDGIATGREEIITEQNDANITSTDVVEGKIGYSKNNTKIVGNLNIQTIKDASYNQGYSEGYGAGESAGIEEGKQEIISGMDDATITPSTVIKGEIGYGANNERIVGEFEYVEGFNFGKIGYSQELSNELNSITAEKLAYSKQFYDAWDPNKTSAQKYFQGNTSLVYAPLFNTSNVTNMNSMFYGCSNLTTVPQFDTSKVSNMYAMFQNCSNLTLVSDFNTSNVTNTSWMFYQCKALETFPLFDTSSVSDLSYMFASCSNLTGAAPNYDLSSATNVRNMYMSCSNLTSIPQYDLSNVTNLGPFLYGCSGLTSIPDFNTTKATNYSETFAGCSKIVTVGLLDMSSAVEANRTFNNCSNLENVVGLTNCGKGFTGNNANNHNLNFSSSSKLTKQSCLNIFNTIYDMTQTSVTDAKITLSSTTKALLSADDIAIATSKGWTIA